MMWEVTPRACKLGALRHSNMQRVGGRVSTDRRIFFLSDNLRMNTLNPEQLEEGYAQALHAHASLLAFMHYGPNDVAAATAAILQAAFIIATADLTPALRSGMFLENK